LSFPGASCRPSWTAPSATEVGTGPPRTPPVAPGRASKRGDAGPVGLVRSPSSLPLRQAVAGSAHALTAGLATEAALSHGLPTPLPAVVGNPGRNKG
jgi:hypothetical protein